ncbi:MAG: mercuric reductase [SAR324 cluster bacterium]|nr:mercuric reductase [SAR324 cluster bacterium]
METALVTPLDEFNQALLANVHPPGWVNPEPKPWYHLVVVGAGAGGLMAAIGAASVGARVAIVERALLGGDCLTVGCVPSKSLIRSSRAVREVERAERLGVPVSGVPQPDFGAVMRRMRRLRSQISENDSVHRLTALGVDVFLGQGAFTAPRTLEVDGKRLQFKKAVIATGGGPFVPPIPGLEEAGYRTNETLFDLTELPRRLLVLGAGPIGSELAQAFRRFGSEVTVVAKDPDFLPREDADAAQILRRQFEREGIAFHFEATLSKVERAGAAKRAVVSGQGEERTLEVDEILVAVGRVANFGELGLEAANVAVENRRVRVSPTLRTSNPRIYAVGDVCLPLQFTHLSGTTGMLAVRNALFRGRNRWTDLVVPWCTYTEPEIAHVGMYEREAKAQGLRVDTFVRHLAKVDRASLDGDDEGFVKIHVRKGSDRILGATIVARHAGEMISELTLAINAGIGLKRVVATIHPYPTQSEAIQQTGGAYYRSKLTPFTRRLLGFLLRLLN